MYYTEMTKIIEAGLKKDNVKVADYSRLLAQKLNKDGEERASKRILNILDKMDSNSYAVMDTLSSLPVDQESRLNLAEVDYSPTAEKLVLGDSVQAMLDDFMKTVKCKDKMKSVGLDFRTSLLLYGPPGCGKTSAAKYVASELGLPIITARLDTLISSLLGSTAKNIHRVFEYAKKQPCVLFLDEFDAIAKARDDSHEMGELKRVVNSLLQNIDDYSENGILIAATNHANLLDSAVWRRFQTIVELTKPEGKEIITFLNDFPKIVSEDSITESQWKTIADLMVGLSYSDIKDIVQNLYKKTILEGKEELELIDFLQEIFLFNNHGNYKMEDLVQYVVGGGISQNKAAKYFAVSTRQVRKSLGKG
jgi:SpoVK/Ycf46/Vps4 family AAA+-type ATPase